MNYFNKNILGTVDSSSFKTAARRVLNCKQTLLLVTTLIFSNVNFALTFSIVPDRPLPTTVPQFGSTAAYYKVTNTTDTPLNNNFVKSLPNSVTQTTCQPKYCGASFNLGKMGSATDSCILKLTVKGPDTDSEHHPLIICTENEVNCNGTDSPLNLTEDAPANLIGISAGSYVDNRSEFLPLVLTTNNNGDTWDYPRSILDNLKTTIDPNFYSGQLNSAGCSGANNKSVCIAAGFYCNNFACSNELPLVAVGRNNVNNWSYPDSVFNDLTTRIDPDFTRGSLAGASCTGYGSNATCIASGVYHTPAMKFPLVALSSNGGSNWTYPPSVFQNLATAIDPSFSGGFLSNASCNQYVCENDSVCIAAGAFCSGDQCDMQLPLIASSTDKGKSWIYSSSVFTDIKTKIDPDFVTGEFVSSNCTGPGNKSLCIAAGKYFNHSVTLPLLAMSTDKGNTWSYPSSIFTNLPTQIDPELKNGFFNAADCTGTGLTARCIAAGAYTTMDGVDIPFLALTKDGGQNWSYPPSIYTKLKTELDPNFTSGSFNGATCTDNGKRAICVAAGKYCADKLCSKIYPLLALTSDGGKTWSYPPSIYKDVTNTIDPNFLRGFFSDVSCTGRGADEGTEGYSFCIASGQYATADAAFPLVAYSKDNGATWTYPPYVFQNLTTTISPDFVLGFFNESGAGGDARIRIAGSISQK